MNLKNLQQNLHKISENILTKCSNKAIIDSFNKNKELLKSKIMSAKEQRLLNKLSMNNLSPNRVTMDRMNRKRRIIIGVCILAFIITAAITTAVIIDKNSLVSQASCDEEATRVKMLEPLLNKETPYLTEPYAVTDFVQPWLFTDYTSEQILEHMKMLKDAGYTNIVLQNVATISGGSKNDAKITSAWYETSLSNDTQALQIYNPTLLSALIDAASNLDMGIYVGIALSDDWLNGAYDNATWRYCNAALINSIIKDIYTKYGNYSCLKGWYIGFDIYPMKNDYNEYISEFLNYILNYVTALESSGIAHPVMITPSINDSYKLTASDIYGFWKNVVQKTNFRTNDIICLFDSLCSTNLDSETIKQYILETKKAVNSSPTDLNFWLCVENYRDITTSVKPADLVRYKLQLNICSKLSDTLASYSFSHYYNPKQVDETYSKEYTTYVKEDASKVKVNTLSALQKQSNNSSSNVSSNTLDNTNESYYYSDNDVSDTYKNNSSNNKEQNANDNLSAASTSGESIEFESSNIATPAGGTVYKDKNGQLVPVPKGFTVSSYANTVNEGLVIIDAHQNEYVWIPVYTGIKPNGYVYAAADKESIYYLRYTNNQIPATTVSNDTLPIGVKTDTKQIEKYHGFYVGRYESSFNYNYGQPTCQIKYTKNCKSDLSFAWKYCNSNTYTGYTWNNISYSDAKSIAENMYKKYNYAQNVKTGLINGTQWDTMLRYIESSSLAKNITSNSTTWGNFTDTTAPANTLNYQIGILKPSGSNVKWSMKNIYDVAGNLTEWTSEISNNKYVLRSGSFNKKGSVCGANFAKAMANEEYTNVGFRVVLYID